jgi:hypothetical protein
LWAAAELLQEGLEQVGFLQQLQLLIEREGVVETLLGLGQLHRQYL